MDQIIMRVENDISFFYTLWRRTEQKNDYNVIKKIGGKTFGMVGTEINKVNFNKIQEEVITAIQKEYPETRNGKIKYCAIEVKK